MHSAARQVRAKGRALCRGHEGTTQTPENGLGWKGPRGSRSSNPHYRQGHQPPDLTAAQAARGHPTRPPTPPGPHEAPTAPRSRSSPSPQLHPSVKKRRFSTVLTPRTALPPPPRPRGSPALLPPPLPSHSALWGSGGSHPGPVRPTPRRSAHLCGRSRPAPPHRPAAPGRGGSSADRAASPRSCPRRRRPGSLPAARRPSSPGSGREGAENGTPPRAPSPRPPPPSCVAPPPGRQQRPHAARRAARCGL